MSQSTMSGLSRFAFEALGSRTSGVDLVVVELERLAQAVGGIGVILDDEYALCATLSRGLALDLSLINLIDTER